ncbi:MAG: hemerythrin domain-containing protein [Planctomycetia bacterium]|nr:MAG: hemerythrin domain-containing protein [Planctomycetia bacterium]
MRPTELLMHEHQVIERVLGCLEKMADLAEAQQPLDPTLAEQAVDFFRSYADRWHHGKEEELLFPMMESKGFSRANGPTGVMLHEHDQGRRLVGAMADAIAGLPAESAAFVENARGYVRLLREHINKENHCLFPMADQALSEAEQKELAASIDRVQREVLDPGTEEKYVAIAQQLADKLGVQQTPSPAGVPGGCHAAGGEAAPGAP